MKIIVSLAALDAIKVTETGAAMEEKRHTALDAFARLKLLQANGGNHPDGRPVFPLAEVELSLEDLEHLGLDIARVASADRDVHAAEGRKS